MTRKQELTELRDKVAAGKWTTDVFWAADAHLGYSESAYCREAFNGSLDAALALHNAVLPGWRYIDLLQRGNRYTCHICKGIGHVEVSNVSTSFSIALLLSILSALIAECDE